MKHLMLTHPKGIILPLNPMAMITWGPQSVEIDGQKTLVTRIACSDGKNRDVLEAFGTVTDLFDRAMAGYPPPSVRLDDSPEKEENDKA